MKKIFLTLTILLSSSLQSGPDATNDFAPIAAKIRACIEQINNNSFNSLSGDVPYLHDAQVSLLNCRQIPANQIPLVEQFTQLLTDFQGAVNWDTFAWVSEAEMQRLAEARNPGVHYAAGSQGHLSYNEFAQNSANISHMVEAAKEFQRRQIDKIIRHTGLGVALTIEVCAVALILDEKYNQGRLRKKIDRLMANVAARFSRKGNAGERDAASAGAHAI